MILARQGLYLANSFPISLPPGPQKNSKFEEMRSEVWLWHCGTPGEGETRPHQRQTWKKHGHGGEPALGSAGGVFRLDWLEVLRNGQMKMVKKEFGAKKRFFQK